MNAEVSKIVKTAQGAAGTDAAAAAAVMAVSPAPAPAMENGAAQTHAPMDEEPVKYRAEQVVLVECEHIREMVGETDAVLRRTRSVAAENAVLNAVRCGGVEPDWFCEWWVEVEGKLVACAVFEDAAKVGGFRQEIQAYAQKLADRGEACPVRLRADEALAEKVAAHFSAEWGRRRQEQMGKYAAVLDDAMRSGKWVGKIAIGAYEAKDADAKAAFGKIAEDLNAQFPKDANGDGGLVYSGFWDKGNVARFCFGFADGVTADVVETFKVMGVELHDPVRMFEDDVLKGVELEMAALVIAKMQGEAKAKSAREQAQEEFGAKMAKAVEQGFAESAKQHDAVKLID